MIPPRVISLFSGVGTFDYGFHQAGWETVYLCEWDAKAREVLSARFPGVPLTNDVRDIKGADLPDAECIMFGSPCQDLSVAGKRGGLDGERSGLFREAIRIIREKREATNGLHPTFALWENVPGAFSSNAGRDFAAVVWEFLNCGARDVSWRVLDSQFFGVPQRRRRIFLVADFGGERAREVLFESEGVRGHPQKGRKAGKAVAADAGQGAEGDGRDAVSVDATLTASCGQGSPRGDGADNLIPVVARCQTTRNQRNDAETENLLPVAFDCKASVQRELMCGAISSTLEAQDKVAIVYKYGEGQSQRIQVNPRVSPTLGIAGGDAGGGGQKSAGLYAFPPAYRVRRLTPEECEALQAMPRGWTDVNGMADSHRYRFMGNGGTSLVLKWLAERMGRAL